MRKRIKALFQWILTFLLCLTVIYLFVFFGGWKFFESGDPILIEIGIAFILSFFLFVINQTVSKLEKRVKSLEEKLKKDEQNTK